MTTLSAWQNFYVIVGSSAGALIGLQFVVMTLIADVAATRDLAGAGKAFGTPTIVHFGAVLLLSALINAPWHSLGVLASLVGVMGLVGVTYVVVVARHMRSQTAYSPQFEDLLCHVLLPFAAYATLVGSAWAARRNVDAALFAVGAAALLLLFVGIHNAWDGVTYHVVSRRPSAGR